MDTNAITILLVDDDDLVAPLVEQRLARFEGARFNILREPSVESALTFLEQPNEIDIIVTDYFLGKKTGKDFFIALKERDCTIPVVFLTVNQDVQLALEVMKLGVQDYLLKVDIASHMFPQSLLRIVEKNRLKKEIMELEIKKNRLEVMQKLVVEVSERIHKPLVEMKKTVEVLEHDSVSEKTTKYFKLIDENLDRLLVKLDKLRNLKEDKTVQYIGNIKMIDLS
jgi:two-component system, NtrC family, response regulator AtoC